MVNGSRRRYVVRFHIGMWSVVDTHSGDTVAQFTTRKEAREKAAELNRGLNELSRQAMG